MAKTLGRGEHLVWGRNMPLAGEPVWEGGDSAERVGTQQPLEGLQVTLEGEPCGSGVRVSVCSA